MRKGPLSNKDKEFIKDNLNMSVSSLSKKLERSEKSVEQYRSTLQLDKTTTEETHTMSMYGRNKKYGVVVMTEGASMCSDENKSKPKKATEIRKIRNSIHRIREE